MTLKNLQALLKDVVTRHKADITYFSGLGSDFNPSSETKFPAAVVQPIGKTRTLSPDGSYTINWAIIMMVFDILPEDRTTDEVNDKLARFDRITDELIFELYEFGYEEKDFIDGNETVKMDFQIPSPIDSNSMIDETESNVTGWITTFTIVEPVDGSDISCCLKEVFN